MEKSLVELFREYIEAVNAIKPIMFQDFQVQSKEELIEKRLPYTKGDFKILGGNEYNFHGRGCRLSNKDFMIDWDFGRGELWCGINPGLFCYYLETEYGKKCSASLHEEVEDKLKRLVDDGIMIKYEGLYYFIEDWNNASERK